MGEGHQIRRIQRRLQNDGVQFTAAREEPEIWTAPTQLRLLLLFTTAHNMSRRRFGVLKRRRGCPKGSSLWMTGQRMGAVVLLQILRRVPGSRLKSLRNRTAASLQRATRESSAAERI